MPRARRSGRAGSWCRRLRWRCSWTRSAMARSASARSRATPSARCGRSSCCIRRSRIARRWRRAWRPWRSSPGSAASTSTVVPVASTDWLARTAESFPAQPIGRFWVHGSHVERAAADRHAADPARCRPGLRLGRARHHAGLSSGARASGPPPAPRAGCSISAAARAFWRSPRPSCGRRACSPPTTIRSRSRWRARTRSATASGTGCARW